MNEFRELKVPTYMNETVKYAYVFTLVCFVHMCV